MLHIAGFGGFFVPLLFGVIALAFFAHVKAERELTSRVQNVLHGGQRHPSKSSRTLLASSLSHLGSLAQALSIFSKKDIADLEKVTKAAGFSPEKFVPVLIGGKLVLMAMCPTIGYFLTRNFAAPWPIVWTCLGVAVGLFGPNYAVGHMRKRRVKALRLGLSDALDLLVVCAEAGLGLESAIDRVATEMAGSSPEVAEEFAMLGQDLRLSSDRGAALIRMGERTGLDSFQRLTSTLSQTLRYGTPLGQALRLLAAEMRNDRLLRLEEKAARLPTLLTVPLALFILPCLFIVVAGPAALRIVRMMH